jgi:hypothetical protein
MRRTGLTVCLDGQAVKPELTRLLQSALVLGRGLHLFHILAFNSRIAALENQSAAAST